MSDHAFLVLTIAVLTAYLAALFLTSLGNRFRKKSSENFFTGGGLGNFPLFCTVAMSIFSGLSYYGYPSSIYTYGIGYLSGVGGYVVTLMFCTVGYRLWKLGKKYNFTSPAEYLRTRYADEHYGYFVAVLLFLFIIPYVATQLIAIGDGIEITTNGAIPYWAAILAFTTVIIAYVFLGGMKSVVWMSILHFFLGYGALFLVVYSVTKTNFDGSFFDGLRTAYQQVASGDSASVLGAPGPQNTFDWKGSINMGLAGAAACIVWPNMFVRCFLAKDKKNFTVMAAALPACTAIMFGMLAIVGAILAPALLTEGVSYPDGIMATISSQFAPKAISLVSLLALCAFAISTIDSFMLVGSQFIARDVYIHYKKQQGDEISEQKATRIGRIAIIVIVIPMLWIAIAKPASITENAYKLASPFFGMIMPATLGGIYWKRATKQGAWAGTLTGIAVTVLFTFFAAPPFGFSAFVWGLLINAVVFIIVSLCTKTPYELAERYVVPFSAKVSS
ncbi:MAG: sodium:solute symporter [Oscillospiraceae bacterium]